MRPTLRQLKLNIYRGTHGGRRPGAGRPRRHSAGVAHAKREVVSARTPVHINFKLFAGLRNKESLRCLRRALTRARSHGLRVLHYSVQSNHVHLIAEAKDNSVLTRSMRALTISYSKGLGRGRLQIERYHLRVLRSVREARNAILYVLFNQQRHSKQRRIRADEYTTLSLLSGLAGLAKELKLTIHRGRPATPLPDRPQSFFARSASQAFLRPLTPRPT